MRRIKIMGLSLVAVCAFSALASTSAFAAKAVPSLRDSVTKAALTKGAPLTVFSSNLVFTTAAGKLECTSNTIEAELLTNGEKKDNATIPNEVSTGEEGGGACKTTTPLGPALLTSSKFPWSTVFETNGKNEVKANKITFTSVFPAAGGAQCVFEAAKAKSTFNTNGAPIILTTTSQKFKANKTLSNAACPKEGTLSGTWTVKTTGGDSVYLGVS